MTFNGGRELPQPTVEIMALYYISYLYEEDWEHAVGIALWDKHGKINPPGSVHAAYLAYRRWFRRVQSVGLQQARKEHLQPLQGTEIEWYGGEKLYPPNRWEKSHFQ